nr:hypothetical protein [Tanacetum cinerariifolium]
IAKIIVDEISTAGAKLNVANEKLVSAAPINITTAQPSKATKITVDITTAFKTKRIVFHDKEESTTRTVSLKSQAKDKGKAKIEAEWNADMKDNIDWNEVVKQVQSRQSDVKQKLEEQQEAEEHKKNLEIVPDDEDNVFMNVIPLSSRPPTFMDYKICKEDLEVLWKIVKNRFKKSQQKEILDVFLWHTLKVMFEHIVDDNVWKHQKGPQGLARVKN